MENRHAPNPGDRRARRKGRPAPDVSAYPTPPVHQQVGLALRADRRRRGQSQRAYAADRELSRARLARVEVDASGQRLDATVALLAGTGYELVVLPVSAERRPPWWDVTDVAARTRAGGRFPAHRKVNETPWGPAWWEYHEMVGSRGLGPRPRWSAQGFTPPPGTRYGKAPTPGPDGKPRWPYNDLPDLPDDEP